MWKRPHSHHHLHAEQERMKNYGMIGTITSQTSFLLK
jgi:hypothetical protein